MLQRCWASASRVSQHLSQSSTCTSKRVLAGFHVAAINCSDAAAAAPKVDDVDEFSKRPPEDEIATRTAYFEALASFWAVKKDTKEVLRRVSRLENPQNWVNVLNAFSVRNQKSPEILEHFEAQFSNAPTTLDTLSSHYLSALAYALSFQDSKKAELFAAIAKRAGAIGAFPESDYVNLENALKKAGVAVPVEVKRAAEAAPLK